MYRLLPLVTLGFVICFFETPSYSDTPNRLKSGIVHYDPKRDPRPRRTVPLIADLHKALDHLFQVTPLTSTPVAEPAQAEPDQFDFDTLPGHKIEFRSSGAVTSQITVMTSDGKTLFEISSDSGDPETSTSGRATYGTVDITGTFSVKTQGSLNRWKVTHSGTTVFIQYNRKRKYLRFGVFSKGIEITESIHTNGISPKRTRNLTP